MFRTSQDVPIWTTLIICVGTQGVLFLLICLFGLEILVVVCIHEFEMGQLGIVLELCIVLSIISPCIYVLELSRIVSIQVQERWYGMEAFESVSQNIAALLQFAVPNLNHNFMELLLTQRVVITKINNRDHGYCFCTIKQWNLVSILT